MLASQLGGGERRSAGYSRSAATPTTSRSVAAGRCSRSTRSHPDVEVTWVVLGAEGERADEARASAEAFLARRRTRRDRRARLPGRLLPYHGAEVKEVFEELKRVEPDLVFTHTRDDLHQDHRLACELTWNTFRDHLILEYEIPKCDGDLGTPEPLRAASSRSSPSEKARRSSPTHSRASADKHWFDAEIVPGPDAHCGAWSARSPSGYAEAFSRRKLRRMARWRLMRVLVTGHHGYIGSVLAPVAREAGHDVVGLDTFFYRGCDFGADRRVGCRRSTRDVRDVDADELDGLRRGRAPRRALERPARRPQPGLDVRHQPRRDDQPRPRGEGGGRAALRLRVVLLDVRRRRRATISLDEDAPLRPLTPYAESKVRAEEALFELADDDFAPVSMRNATAYGVSPRLRLDIVLNNLVGWAHTTGAIRLPERRHGLAAARPHPGHRGARGRAARARRQDDRSRRGVQHRLGGAELPDPRPRRGRAQT